jgi:uncharacterized protein (DUF1778 family)
MDKPRINARLNDEAAAILKRAETETTCANQSHFLRELICTYGERMIEDMRRPTPEKQHAEQSSNNAE